MMKKMNNLKNYSESAFKQSDFPIQVKHLVAEIDQILLKQNNFGLSCWEKAHYKAIKNWLVRYETSSNNLSNLRKVKGYIEALYHLCKVKDWDKIKNILSIKINNNSSDYQFHFQLGIWGLYKQQISIYCSLLGKIDDKWDCQFLEGLGNAYDALGSHEKAINYRQQWRQLAREIGDKHEEGKALCDLGISDSFSGDLILAALNVDPSNIKSITPRWKRTQYRAVVNWITKYKVSSNLSNLEKMKGFLEAFYYFCELEAWLEAKRILLIRFDTPTNEELHEQLQTWGFYSATLDLYNKLSTKLDSRWEAISLTGIGKIYHVLGWPEQAIYYFQEGKTLNKDIGDLQTERNVLSNLGKTHHFLGNNSDALKAHIESLNIAKKIGDQASEGLVMSDLGVTYSAIKDKEKAIYYLQKSLDIAHSTDNKLGKAIALEGLGFFCLQQNDYEHSLEYSQQQLTLAREIGYRKSETTSLSNLGSAYLIMGQPDQAITCFEQELAIAEEIQYRRGEASSLESLGSVYHQLGSYERAISYYQKSFNIARRTSDRYCEIRTLRSLGSVYHQLGNYNSAFFYYQESLELARQIGDYYWEGRVLRSLENLQSCLFKLG